MTTLEDASVYQFTSEKFIALQVQATLTEPFSLDQTRFVEDWLAVRQEFDFKQRIEVHSGILMRTVMVADGLYVTEYFSDYPRKQVENFALWNKDKLVFIGRIFTPDGSDRYSLNAQYPGGELSDTDISAKLFNIYRVSKMR